MFCGTTLGWPGMCLPMCRAMSRAWMSYSEALTARESAMTLVLPGVGEQTEIRLARWGAQAGVRGAAQMAAHELAVAGS